MSQDSAGLPFTIELKSGIPVHRQIVYAVTKAVVTGHLQPGESFPSVRVLSQQLRINPNTAHKVVSQLVQQGLLEVRPGIGTVVRQAPPASPAQRRQLLREELEHLVVEAKKLSLDFKDVLEAVREHWNGLDKGR